MTEDITISVDELTHDLAQVLQRVRDQREQFSIEQDGQPVARLTPSLPPATFTMEDFVALIERLPHPDGTFADDLEAIQNTQSRSAPPAWPC